ncbi:transposon Tf2-6 polyprotein [Trichonephila inaurata madagascariensis]|uniref:Transposon Tf2-6 polyprotein n=1 Tax=Trichonephila inaurata madagascariensis TaxID=2747483 RepID=A0A8X6M963_9ARAC|nr:transposon Tf2-6 polyprotein [Trichonephila inaurata madagascariensis]
MELLSDCHLIFSPQTRLPLPAIKHVSFLREKMRALQPIPTFSHSNSSMFVPTNLKSCSHVFLRVDSVQPPLSQNYTGPHEVIRRTDSVHHLHKWKKESSFN